MSVLWPAGLLARSSGACHFFILGSSLWVAPWFFLVKTPCRPQSLAVYSLVTSTLRARTFPWRRSLLWRNSYILERDMQRHQTLADDWTPGLILKWGTCAKSFYKSRSSDLFQPDHQLSLSCLSGQGCCMSAVYTSQTWRPRKVRTNIGILTSAEATCWAMVNILLSVISHEGFTLSWKNKTGKVFFGSEDDSNLVVVFDTWSCVNCIPEAYPLWKPTSLHRHRKLSRSRFSSSSTTVTSGARRETTPSSSGRKGCGPSWAKKDAKPRKLCLSVASAESVKTEANSAVTDTNVLQSPRQQLKTLPFFYLLERAAPHSCFPYGPCRGTQWCRSAGRRQRAEEWPGWRTRVASDEATLGAGQWEWKWAWMVAAGGWVGKMGWPQRCRGFWRGKCRGGGRWRRKWACPGRYFHVPGHWYLVELQTESLKREEVNNYH